MERPITVLIVDDEPHVLHVVGAKLRASGLRVAEARDGEEALEIAGEVKPDLIVTDMQMPRMDGLRLAQRLYENAALRTTPLLMLTARGHIVPEGELAKTNIRELMAKPFSARQLLERVRAMLGMANEPAQAA